ncbi:MAG TPA: hypothetical protein VF128_08745 [Gemmatimonadaceae bacterium]
MPAAAHLGRAAQVPLAVGAEARAHLVQLAPVADRRQHVVHEPAGRLRVMDVVGHHPGNVERARQGDELPDECLFLGQTVVPALDGQAPVEQVEEGGDGVAGPVGVSGRQAPRHPPRRAAGEREEAARVAGQRVERDGRVAARGVHAGAGDEGAQVSVPLARLGQHDEVGALAAGDHGQLGTEDAGEIQLPGCLGEPDGAAEVVVVGQGQGRHA